MTLAAAACAPPPADTAAKAQAAPRLADAFGAALEAEAKQSAAAGPYLDAIERAVAEPRAEGALATVIAATDALVFGATPGLEVAPAPVAFRGREAMAEIVARLTRAWSVADVEGRGAPALPFVRGILASALQRIALRVGDERAAATWSARRGCAQEAVVLGPTDWTPLRGLEGASPVGSAPGAPLQRTYAGIAPFAASLTPERVAADACALDVDATSFLQGTRVVVLDLDNPAAQRVGLALSSPSAAVLEIGGVTAIRRGYEAGGTPVTRLATVQAEAGRLRVVVRVAQKNDGASIALDVWGEDGLPLRARAPRPGDAGTAKASRPEAVEPSAPNRGSTFGAPGRLTAPSAPNPGRSEADLVLGAAALLGLGDARAAEHLLERREPAVAAKAPAAAEPARSPRVELLYARAVTLADDLPDTKIFERSRKAIDRVLAAWPGSWEARLRKANLVERRRGAGEGVIVGLTELGAGGAGAPAVPDADRMILAQIAAVAYRASLPDVAEAAYARLASAAPGSALVADVDARIHRRVGADAVKAACAGGQDRSSTACLDALQERGELGPILTEIDRLRRLRRAPAAFREVELHQLVVHGELGRAIAVYDSMEPAERRMLQALGLAAGRGDPRVVRQRLRRDRASARDAPYAIAPLVRALGLAPDPAPQLEAEGRKLVLQDQSSAFLPGAATAVLRHVERYTVAPDGLLYYVTYDLRRVSGTTDVATGAVAYGPMIEGRGTPHLLRRRIHKRDGRVLSPDAAANAAQSHSDLSQLEQGDYVEQITEGWALPSDTGQLVIDTSDLLPERTSVREAEIHVRRPRSIPFSVWAHPLLGKAEERVEGGETVTLWRLANQAPRRIEDGIPRLERSVGISMGTQTWDHVARAIEENIRSLDDRDPFVARFAQEIAGPDRAPSRALVERVVAAIGKKVKIAGGSELSDVAAIFGGGAQRTTARTILELGEGSRSWVIYRVLRELGVPAEIAVAETEPFSASPDFPPHVGRFRHPLVVARLGGAGGDVWIDADVEGPPLPPGRISPELRGRSAMLPGGKLVTVEGTSGETGDEIDLRLAVDPEGNARGSFTILLHGRAAQSLAEAFQTVVGTDRREMLRGVVLGWLPWADVEDVTVSSTEGSWEVSLRAAITIHGFARPEGKDGRAWTLPGVEPVHLVFPRAFTGTLGATYASRGARQSALSIDTALQYHVRRRIELPPGTKVARAPGEVRVDHARIQAGRKGSYGAVIEEDFSLSLPTGTVSAEDYKGFVERVQAIDSGFMAGIRLEGPANAESRPTLKGPAKAGPKAAPKRNP